MNTPEDFADMAIDLWTQPDTDETLSSVIEYAKDALDCDHAGVHLIINGEIETAAATDELIREADRLQTKLGEGPCLEAIASKATFIVHDTAHDPRWPKFGPHAAELGLHSILSVRLQINDRAFGALNFYCTNPREFGAEDVSIAEVFATHASVALATARREEGLKLAIDTRELIGQAQGILMERFNLDASRAFQVLRRYSQDHNVKLRIVAQQLVETRRLPD